MYIYLEDHTCPYLLTVSVNARSDGSLCKTSSPSSTSICMRLARTSLLLERSTGVLRGVAISRINPGHTPNDSSIFLQACHKSSLVIIALMYVRMCASIEHTFWVVLRTSSMPFPFVTTTDVLESSSTFLLKKCIYI